MELLPSWRDQLVQQAQLRIVDENINRIFKCLDMLSDEQIWLRIHQHTNPIGNLILHLEGNARQWILATFCHQTDTRQRQLEFDSTEKIPKIQLREKLNQLAQDLNLCFQKISEQELLDEYEVQCYHETGISILVHVIEHFSYHTGQIAYLTKWLAEKETGFYEGQNLDKIKI